MSPRTILLRSLGRKSLIPSVCELVQIEYGRVSIAEQIANKVATYETGST